MSDSIQTSVWESLLRWCLRGFGSIQAVMQSGVKAFRRPSRLWSRGDVLGSPSAVPNAPGIYGWYLRELPPVVPTTTCVACDGLTLLYIGIAPRPPAQNGRISKRTLRTRLRQHYALNAAGSTLRLTLGCLLAQQLGIELRRVGNGQRMTFGAGEQTLSNWMSENAFVCWHEHSAPWEIEVSLIRELHPPLNLAENSHHSFHTHLSQIRKQAKARARSLDVMPKELASVEAVTDEHS
jgi:hypothetical protein